MDGYMKSRRGGGLTTFCGAVVSSPLAECIPWLSRAWPGNVNRPARDRQVVPTTRDSILVRMAFLLVFGFEPPYLRHAPISLRAKPVPKGGTELIRSPRRHSSPSSMGSDIDITPGRRNLTRRRVA